jgi:hypothetical protein
MLAYENPCQISLVCVLSHTLFLPESNRLARFTDALGHSYPQRFGNSAFQ